MSYSVVKEAKHNPTFNVLWLFVVELCVVGWVISFFLIVLSRRRRKRALANLAPRLIQSHPPRIIQNVPTERIVDVGGLEEAKEQIRSVVQVHLRPEKSKRYGVPYACWNIRREHVHWAWRLPRASRSWGLREPARRSLRDLLPARPSVVSIR